MARSTKADALETRERIIDAAEDVFYTQGVSRTSLADVAKAAGVTRGAIYWHFENKTDLFNAMCERVRLPLEGIVEASLAADQQDPLGAFMRGCVINLQESSRNPRWRRILEIVFKKCELVDENDPLLVRERECNIEIHDKVVRILQSAIDKEQLDPKLNLTLCHKFVHSALTGLIEGWIVEGGKSDLGEDADRVMMACMFAIQNAPSLRND